MMSLSRVRINDVDLGEITLLSPSVCLDTWKAEKVPGNKGILFPLVNLFVLRVESATGSRVVEGKFSVLQRDVVACRLCPRLVNHREWVKKTKTRRFAHQVYWGKPVPAFGDPKARLLIVGLAPAAHGANRTGRMFTGDRSGDWLYEALHHYGFANRAESIDRTDGLRLMGATVTAVARCAPPANKPTVQELANCRPYLAGEIELLTEVRVVIALGRIAFAGFLAAWKHVDRPVPSPRPRFAHGSVAFLDGPSTKVTLLGCYHPSQQNTFTGRLTREMFHRIFRDARDLLDNGEWGE
jgi:uracil-DNA glycosylase family 4